MKSRLRGSMIAVVFVAASAICGAIGYAIGMLAALHSMQQTLSTYALERSAAADRYPTEGLHVLAELGATSFPPCSNAELDNFRRVVLKSQFIKDVGRMRGEQLACSASFQASGLPSTTYKPAYKEPAGDLLYLHMDALRIGNLTPIVMRMGDFYVAFDPYRRDDIPRDIQFALTMKNVTSGKSNYLGGTPFPGTKTPLKINSSGHSGGYLYATRCSDHFLACLTTYIPVRQALHDQRQFLWGGLLAGVLTGNCIGLLFLAFYRRARGIEHQLRRAINQDKLYVVYQPLVDLISREVVGSEALVRWTDEDGLAIPPDVFVKIAEDRGFINLITKTVIRRVLAEFGQHMAENPEFRVNVNISAHDLSDPAFPPMLEDALTDARVMAASIGIELTETATTNNELAKNAIARLRDRGHSVYIDDFGTGYSSLAYLRDLSVDGLKIDQSFTRTVGTDSVTEGILPLILAMSQTLGLSAIAEGIETEAHYAYYQATSLPLIGQGWFFGRPVPVDEFHRRWLPVGKPLMSDAAQD